MLDDETLRKEKYKCVFSSADGVTIFDLYFKSPNPVYNRRVSLKNGEYILTELLDFEDLKKSRLTGALSKFIEMGWIVVENASVSPMVKEGVRKAVRATPPSSAITEIQAGIIHAKDISNRVSSATSGYQHVGASSLGFPEEAHQKTTETLSLDKSRTINSLAISEVTAQQATSAYDKFTTLRYFQKLKTIKDSTDQTLLSLIIAKSNYPQLVHNSKNRLRELTTGR